MVTSQDFVYILNPVGNFRHGQETQNSRQRIRLCKSWKQQRNFSYKESASLPIVIYSYSTISHYEIGVWVFKKKGNTMINDV